MIVSNPTWLPGAQPRYRRRSTPGAGRSAVGVASHDARFAYAAIVSLIGGIATDWPAPLPPSYRTTGSAVPWIPRIDSFLSGAHEDGTVADTVASAANSYGFLQTRKPANAAPAEWPV